MKHIQAGNAEKAKAKGGGAGVDGENDLRNRKKTSVAEAQGGEGKWRARQGETWAGPTWQGLGGHCTGFRFYSNAMQHCLSFPGSSVPVFKHSQCQAPLCLMMRSTIY